MTKRQLRIIYRSNSHAPLWLVAEKSGAWEKNGLSVDTSPQLIREKAVESLKERTRRSDFRQSSQPVRKKFQERRRLRSLGSGDK
jgi:hypothetical protein